MLARLLRRQTGGASLILALAFLVLAVPLVTGNLGLASTLSQDSRVKTEIAKRHYSVVGGVDYAVYRLRYEPGYADSLQANVPDTITVALNGGDATITITRLAPGAGPRTGAARWADVVLALDNSGSIDSGELQELKNAANTLVDRFQLDESEGRMRIGISRFRGSSASNTPMTDVDDHGASPPVTPLHDGINSLQKGGPGLASGTNIVKGLEGAATQFATGLGDRPDVPNLIIFLTDGLDTNGNGLAEIASASQATGAEVFAVGVGADVDTPTLNAIATDNDPSDPGYDPADPNAGHRFYASDFSGLLALIDSLVEAVYAAAENRTFLVASQAPGGTTAETQVVLPP